MTFEKWRKEAEQMLLAWYCDDPACVDKDHWRQCFDHNYRPWEAARYTAELLHQRATCARCEGLTTAFRPADEWDTRQHR